MRNEQRLFEKQKNYGHNMIARTRDSNQSVYVFLKLCDDAKQQASFSLCKVHEMKPGDVPVRFSHVCLLLIHQNQ